MIMNVNIDVSSISHFYKPSNIHILNQWKMFGCKLFTLFESSENITSYVIKELKYDSDLKLTDFSYDAGVINGDNLCLDVIYTFVKATSEYIITIAVNNDDLENPLCSFYDSHNSMDGSEISKIALEFYTKILDMISGLEIRLY